MQNLIVATKIALILGGTVFAVSTLSMILTVALRTLSDAFVMDSCNWRDMIKTGLTIGLTTVFSLFFVPCFVAAYLLTHMFKLGSEEDRENMPTPMEFVEMAYDV